mmetsp:Transcript_28059/g.77224  ORF Transcript_28059/g.77224 Transcript_28059/m.77224 type:complete len:434 (-) Transcript_28059:259-1560(-)
MSRYASPSPSNMLYEAPLRRGGRVERGAPAAGAASGHSGGLGEGDGGGEPSPWGGRSCSRSASQRPPSQSRPRSRSRSRGTRQYRRWSDAMDEQPPSPPSLPADDFEHRHRRARRHRDSPRPVHGSGAARHAATPKAGDRGREKIREKGREKGKVQGRRGHGRDRNHDYARKLAAQQAPLHMAMMQGMMVHPMQMAMMGMVPPPYLAAMQRPPQAAPHMMFGAEGSRPKRRRSARGFGDGGGASSSSSSDSSDSESSGECNEVMNPAAAMAAMAAMWPAATAAAAGSSDVGTVANVEAFLSSCPIDPEAAKRMRALPPALQQSVLRRGPIADTRNPSAVLIARVRDAELGRAEGSAEADRSSAVLSDERGPKPARRSAKVTIEAMIRDYRLSPGCAWMLRALPPDKQKLAARIDPAGQADPSGYVAEQLKKIV